MKSIILTKKKTQVEIKDVDGWIYDLKYTINGKETYSAQILKPDIAGRIKRLQDEGFTRLLTKKEARKFIANIEKSC
jgi:hypothetical protein